MAPLNSLPDDQRLVLQLLLEEGQSYAEIAELLSIDRAVVRARTLAAFDTVVPLSDIPLERRALIVDYLAGQLAVPVADEIGTHVRETTAERAWVSAIRSELAPALSLAITDGSNPAAIRPSADQPASHMPVRAPAVPTETPPATVDATASASTRRSGARLSTLTLVTGVVAILAVAAVIVVLSSRGANPKAPPVRSTATASVVPPGTSSTAASIPPATTSTATSRTSVHVLARIKLAPATPASKITGIAVVLREGSTRGLEVGATNVPANTKRANAYAVWLYNSPTDTRILGFVSPGVGKNGRLTTAGALPSNASHYRTLIVSLETNANPKTPGTIILRGTLAGL